MAYQSNAGIMAWATSMRLNMANDPGRQYVEDQIQEKGFKFLDDYLAMALEGPKDEHFIELVKTPARTRDAPKRTRAAVATASKMKSVISMASLAGDDKENEPTNSVFQDLLHAKASKDTPEDEIDTELRLANPFHLASAAQKTPRKHKTVTIVQSPTVERIPAKPASVRAKSPPQPEPPRPAHQNDLSTIAEQSERGSLFSPTSQANPRPPTLPPITEVAFPTKPLPSTSGRQPSPQTTRDARPAPTKTLPELNASRSRQQQPPLGSTSLQDPIPMAPPTDSNAQPTPPQVSEHPSAPVVQPLVLPTPPTENPQLPTPTETLPAATQRYPTPESEPAPAPSAPAHAPATRPHAPFVPSRTPAPAAKPLSRQASMPFGQSAAGPSVARSSSAATFAGMVALAATPGTSRPAGAGGKRTSWLRKVRESKSVVDFTKRASAVPGGDVFTAASGPVARSGTKRKSEEMLAGSGGPPDPDERHAKVQRLAELAMTPAAVTDGGPSGMQNLVTDNHAPEDSDLQSSDEDADGGAPVHTFRRAMQGLTGLKGKSLGGEALTHTEARAATEAAAARVKGRWGDEDGEAMHAEARAREEEKEAREDGERRIKEEQERHAKEEQERRDVEEQERRAKQEQERRAREEEERRAREAEVARLEEERRRLEEENRRAQELVRLEEEKRRAAEAELARREAAELKRQEEEGRAKLEAERRAEEEREIEFRRAEAAEKERRRQARLEKQRLREEAKQRELERKRQEEAERQHQEELERQRREEAERKRQEEAERQHQEELERKRQEELERKRLEEAERQRQEELEQRRKEEQQEKQRMQELEMARKEKERRLREEEEERARQEKAERIRIQQEQERLRKQKVAEEARLEEERKERQRQEDETRARQETKRRNEEDKRKADEERQHLLQAEREEAALAAARAREADKRLSVSDLFTSSEVVRRGTESSGQAAGDSSSSTTPPDSPPAKPPLRLTSLAAGPVFKPPPALGAGTVFSKPKPVFSAPAAPAAPPPADSSANAGSINFALRAKEIFHMPATNVFSKPFVAQPFKPAPLSDHSSKSSFGSDSLFDTQDRGRDWIPTTQETEYSVVNSQPRSQPLPTSQSSLQQRKSGADVGVDDDFDDFDEDVVSATQAWKILGFSESNGEQDTWSTVRTQSQKGDTGNVKDLAKSSTGKSLKAIEDNRDEDVVQGDVKRNLPGAFETDIELEDDGDDEPADDSQEEDDMEVDSDEPDLQEMAAAGKSTIALVKKAQSSAESQADDSQMSFFGHATKLVTSVLGGGKKVKAEPVKSIQLAQAAAKKDLDDKEKKAERLRQQEARRQAVIQRKQKVERARQLEDEKKVREEMEKRKREREELTDKRPLKLTTKKGGDDDTKKRKLVTDVEKKPPAMKPPSKDKSQPTVIRPPAKPKAGILKQPSVSNLNATAGTSQQYTGTSTAPKPGPAPTPAAASTASKGKGKATAKEHDDDSRPPAKLLQKQMQERAKAQMQSKQPPREKSENIELPDVASEYSDSEDEDRKQFQAPDWAQSPAIAATLQHQSGLNPDDIFGAIQPLRMEEIFRGRASKFRSRTSSANWAGADQLTEAEETAYAKRMGYR